MASFNLTLIILAIIFCSFTLGKQPHFSSYDDVRQNIVVQCKNCLNGWWGLVVMIILFNTYLSCFLKGSARDLLADASFPFLTSYMMHRHIRDGRESEEAAPNLQS